MYNSFKDFILLQLQKINDKTAIRNTRTCYFFPAFVNCTKHFLNFSNFNRVRSCTLRSTFGGSWWHQFGRNAPGPSHQLALHPAIGSHSFTSGGVHIHLHCSVEIQKSVIARASLVNVDVVVDLLVVHYYEMTWRVASARLIYTEKAFVRMSPVHSVYVSCELYSIHCDPNLRLQLCASMEPDVCIDVPEF